MSSTPSAAGAAEPLNKPIYTKAALVLLVMAMAVTTAGLLGFVLYKDQDRALIDFHAFYVASQLFWNDIIDQAYRFEFMGQFERDFMGEEIFMPWTYPPQFVLVVAPFSLLPIGVSYVLFTGTTLAAYLLVLRKIAGPNFHAVLLATLPALLVAVVCGQNGLLTASLIGLACLGSLRGRAIAGLPLGLLAMKPHLGVGLGLYTLLTGRWRMAGVAALTVAATSALATLVLGVRIWPAFAHGLHEMQVFLKAGFYPLFRMVSVYASLRAFDAPAAAAMAVQAVVACIGLALIWRAVRRKAEPRQQLGVAVLGTLLVSPYLYDYDLAVLGISLALLLPDLVRLGSAREQAAVFALSFSSGLFGLAQARVIELQHGPATVDVTISTPPSFGGIVLVALVLLIGSILRRDGQPARIGAGPSGIEGMPVPAGA